ncbi:hypothetical protein LCER1_G004851 [Lachnellula cervina]|uniref:Heterokaryon incompatibility domain-containing protein n=1 Tax=Lachnellula cervina TaxID=1316786 RepID=A0A7D8Z790_9HELO|nr:hypothetical protein LCER1_G004851 [Lachnellula cervina]
MAKSRPFVGPEWNSKFFVQSDLDSSDSDSESLSNSPANVQADSREKEQRLCSRCSQMFATLDNLRCLTSRDGYKHHTKAELRESAKGGCPFCKEVLCQKRTTAACFDDDEPLESLKFFARREGTKEENLLVLPLIEESFPDIEGYEEFVAYPFEKWKIAGIGCGTSECGYNIRVQCVFTESDNPAAKYVERRSLAANFESSTKMFQAQRWLEDCRLEHPDCPRHLVPKLPTRVIDVGELGNSQSVRLHVRDRDEKAEYVALSYCWGGPQLFTTTISTLEDNIRSLPENKLPKTIQHAILVTRCLGIRYLWVDALCIIQDSYADKISEIANMGAIYKSATVTISAACASGVNVGFLWNRNRWVKKAYQFPFLLPDGKMTTVSLASFDVRTQQLTVEAIDQRAWCFQESLLSPRQLVFGSRELLWNCQTLQNEPIAKSNTAYLYDLRRLPRSVFSPQYADTHTNFERARIWNTIVESYTRRSISRLDDRLLAIEGVAEELAHIWNDTHVFGLMRGTLIRNLSWHIAVLSDHMGYPSIEPVLPIPTTLSFPSWTWVSVDSPVTIVELNVVDAALVSVTDENSTLHGPEIYGSTGKLVLKAKMLSMQDFSEDIFDKLQASISVDREDKMAVNNTSVLLLLGSSDGEGEISLILRRSKDGMFERIGLMINPFESLFKTHLKIVPALVTII